jgi:hypothetical protein
MDYMTQTRKTDLSLEAPHRSLLISLSAAKVLSQKITTAIKIGMHICMAKNPIFAGSFKSA